MSASELHQERPVVLVDAYGRGSELAKEMAKHCALIHIASKRLMPAIFQASFRPEYFSKQYIYQAECLTILVEELLQYRPRAILAANEYGVELSDLLSSKLGLPGNGTRLSKARRDKVEMAKAVETNDVITPDFSIIRNVKEAIDWFHRSSTKVVIKPLNSAGSEDVYICSSEPDVQLACESILGKENIMSSINESALIQEFINGVDIMINNVSYCGKHWTTDIWMGEKKLTNNGKIKIYDRFDLTDPNSDLAKKIAATSYLALEALGIEHGPSHMEMILADDQLYFIECGARITGQIIPTPFSATNMDQIQMTIDAVLTPAELDRYPQLYQQYKQSTLIEFMVQQSGQLNHSYFTELCGKLPSFSHLRFRLEDRSYLTPTSDLSSTPGTLFLIHQNRHQIDIDYQTFRENEQKGYV